MLVLLPAHFHGVRRDEGCHASAPSVITTPLRALPGSQTPVINSALTKGCFFQDLLADDKHRLGAALLAYDLDSNDADLRLQIRRQITHRIHAQLISAQSFR